ncbi:MAG: isoprenylcysteine carboxylmethyltransferase family protein [Acidobacteria bacterium]|nr:isoprenylcysteine carboxylmethyltransferase family protein [Acidobacteriota bacterium]NIQ85111.1 isoprenylcysteine carboxylmethyltransferase family protein [Acidobacteriota bacterium]
MNYPRKILPPVYFLLALIVMGALHRYVPVAVLVASPYRYGGVALIVLGLGVTIAAAGLFFKLGTPLRPFEESTLVVTTGMFRFTRNPMYLGMVLVLVGTAVMLGTLVAFLPVPPFVAIIRLRFIRNEERFMEDLFGEEYLAYKRKVRRWI